MWEPQRPTPPPCQQGTHLDLATSPKTLGEQPGSHIWGHATSRAHAWGLGKPPPPHQRVLGLSWVLDLSQATLSPQLW